MGAAVVELRARRMSVMESGIGLLISHQPAYSFAVPGISVGAHIGGLIGGALAGLAIRTADDRHRSWLGLVGLRRAVRRGGGGLDRGRRRQRDRDCLSCGGRALN